MADAPEPHDHAQIIDALGGTGQVSALVRRASGRPTFATQNVSGWRRHGIPHKYRPLIAAEIAGINQLRDEPIVLPANFVMR